ncbi:amino acid adenylation domain-containing protein [Streptomyces sp. NPDC088846]|uniref:amino acid adenylation domain-containing protein n=1 Tax=Streptomyces sp. NPDC088846 TaxID=3365908 RepID=UPI0037FF9092
MIFQHQTIAEIAARAEERSTIWAEQGPVQGEAHVTPIQRWFFDLELPDPGLFNQSRLLETQGLEPTTLAKALAVLVEHHDALRLRFEHGAEGWTQTHAAYEDSGLCAHFDLSGVPDGEVRARMEGGADEVQHGMDLTNGPLLRAALFDLGGARGQRLLLTVHHLVVDAVSWHILLEDLGSAYESLAAGEPAVLPMKTTSYQAWSARLRHHASTAEAHSPLAYWTRPRTAAAVPRDRDGDNTNVSYDSVTVALDTEETASLLREVPRTFDVRINDVLLTAVARAVSAWTESPSVLVALEGHGREDLFPDVDLSRTVGWFTSIFPVELHTDPQDDVTASLLRVRDQLAEVPDRGVGYGILRYCGDADVQERLRSLPRPEISFNYLGQFESAVPGLGRFAGADEPMGQAESPAGRRAHLIDILASVQSGSLSVTVSFSRNIHEKRTAETLAARLGSVLRDVLRAGREQAGPGGERAAERESYELTPLQAGMLFHSLSDPLDTSEVRPYVVQFADEFIGPLDTDLFRSAWQRVVDRHTILRSGFGTDSDGTPVQVVQPEAELRFDELDWRSAGAEEQGALLKRLLVDDRNRGFDLEAAPLMRFTLARTADDRVLVLWSFHHLLLDGWSAQLVQHEFYTLYRSSLAREEDALAAPVPYSRYIEWLQAQSAAEAEAYWRRRLSGFQAPTGLGVDRDTGDTGFGDLTFALDTVQFSRVRRFARTHRLTVNTVVQGLWALLLSRYSGSDDVLFGATVSGRPADLPDMERMVGPFINTLPVRVEVPADAQVADWLKQVQDQHVELRGYEYSSLADVQGWSDVPRSEQLFRSILVFENYPQLLDGAELPDGLERKFLLYVERTGYPLVLGAAETGDELSFHLVYDRSLFDAATADRMAGHLTTLLAGMLDDPAGALSGLGMLSAAELRQFAEWNDTAMDHPHDRTVHELIEERAALAPDAIAVSFGDASLTYGELNVRANRLAHHLRRKGVRPGVLVGLCVERGLDMIVALLGVLKSGGAYVPLDRGYPAERLDFMIKDTGTPVIVTQGHLVGRLPAHDCETILLDEHRDGSDTREAADPEPLAGPEDLAYVIYTSGSTGTPKGVMIEHRSMSDRMQEMRRQYGLTAEDTYLQFSSVTFDGSVGEIFPTLVAGAELVLRGDDWNPAWILETLHNKEVTVCQLPPFVWNELTAQITSSADLGPRLRLMSMGGEKVLAASVDRWFQHTSIPLFNIYGPTEATVNMTTCLITGPSAIVSIGGPVANAQALVVDEHGRQVPVGVPGELWIGGNIGLSRGYLNRPELTAEKFVRHPLSDDPRSRAYRTGDLVRRLPDGTLDILGRMDDQVKLRGFRIELGEVESTLLSHPDVGACVVVLVEDGPEGKRLVAYCVPAPGKQPGVSDLREWCVRGLPDYMVPSAFVLLDVLPSTANGKAVDRKALPAPDGARPAIATAFAAPRPGTEERLAEIWRDVLALDQVGRHDNFFELGGNSFLSVQVIGRARKNRIRLTPRVIFQNPTLAELAAHLDGGGPAAGTGRSGAAAARAEQPRPVRPASGRFAVVGAVEGQEDSRVAVVRLNESAAERVVFCFHEGGGNVSGYVHLADALSPVARVIGIEARSVAFDAEPEDDVAAMARSYWRAMREMQPSGPYVLAGWSFGGALAIEIASLVAGAGERVGLLVALDSCLPVSGARGMIEADHEALVRLLAHVGTGGAPTGGPETSAEVDALMRALNLPADVLSLPRGELVRHLRTMEAHTRAVLHHRPPVVDCPVLLYQAAESPWVLPLAESWQPFADRVDARVVPGGHLSFLLAPHVEALAAEIAAALRELDD